MEGRANSKSGYKTIGDQVWEQEKKREGKESEGKEGPMGMGDKERHKDPKMGKEIETVHGWEEMERETVGIGERNTPQGHVLSVQLGDRAMSEVEDRGRSLG